VSAPRLSVLLPVHDAEAHLRDAIASILGQTFADFEVIVVDDGSTDGSLEITRELGAEDRRLHVIPLEDRVGVAGALNEALSRASAPMVARMDADDVAHPERFAVQVAEMDRDPSLGLLGAQIRVIGDDGAEEKMFPWVLPLTHDETVWRLLYGTPICHPTVLMRTEVLREVGGYDSAFANEDMELWTRMAFVTRMRNLDAIVLDYRMPAVEHAERLAAWQPHISRVVQRYVERIIGAPVDEAVVLALRRVGLDHQPADAFEVLTRLSTASLLAQCFDRMTALGMFAGDGLRQVSELRDSDVQELAAGGHEWVVTS
jgi:glycosyltransferase involved in cell wall biosynthesis